MNMDHNEMALKDIKVVLRSGKYAWPGGYPLYFITRDGGVLSFEAVRAEWRQVVWDHLRDCSTGWRVVGVDDNLWCDHFGQRIPRGIISLNPEMRSGRYLLVEAELAAPASPWRP